MSLEEKLLERSRKQETLKELETKFEIERAILNDVIAALNADIAELAKVDYDAWKK